MKNTIVQRVANLLGKNRKEVKEVFDALMEEIKEQLKEGNKVNIKEFGTFSVKTRAATTVFHPQTKEKIAVPARRVPYFKASPKFKKNLNE